MGTQWLIAQKAIDVNKAESSTMGDILKQFAVNMPAVIDVITLALLNDKNKIYQNGRECEGFSDLYRTTRDTLTWDCDPTKFAELLLDIFQILLRDLLNGDIIYISFVFIFQYEPYKFYGTFYPL